VVFTNASRTVPRLKKARVPQSLFGVSHNNIIFKNSLIIHEENTKKNHKRVVSLYVDKDFPSFT
jgi:hypothetical protein